MVGGARTSLDGPGTLVAKPADVVAGGGPPGAASSTDLADGSPVTPLAEERDRLPARVKWAYASGGMADVLGHWLYFNLADPVYNGYFHLSPAQIGNVKAATLVADAFAGVLFGWLSDNTRSRWGRRRPYILIGALLSGLCLPLLFLPSRAWGPESIFAYMLLSAVLYSPLIASYNSAYQALGAELTPDYHERSSVMAHKAVIQKCVVVLIGGGVWISGRSIFADPDTGVINSAHGAMAACGVAGVLMIAAGIINSRYVPERYYQAAVRQGTAGLGRTLGSTVRCAPFLVLLGVGFLYSIPTFAVDPLGYYAGYYYVLRDLHPSGSAYAVWGEIKLWSGVAYATLGVLGVIPAQLLARRFGKRAALSLILLLGIVSFSLSWVLYTPSAPWLVVLHTGITGFCATGLWVVLPSMTADTVDYEELRSGQRREGAFASAFFWAMKAGMGAASIVAGQALGSFTGFRAELGGQQSAETFFLIRALFAGIPIVACFGALLLLLLYPLSAPRMAVIRRSLEARRGVV